MSKPNTYKLRKGSPSQHDHSVGGKTNQLGWLSDQEITRRQSKVSYLHDEVPPLPERVVRQLDDGAAPSESGDDWLTNLNALLAQLPADLAAAVAEVRRRQFLARRQSHRARSRGWQNPQVRAILLADRLLATQLLRLARPPSQGGYGGPMVRKALGISRQGLRDVVLHHGLQPVAVNGARRPAADGEEQERSA